MGQSNENTIFGISVDSVLLRDLRFLDLVCTILEEGGKNPDSWLVLKEYRLRKKVRNG